MTNKTTKDVPAKLEGVEADSQKRAGIIGHVDSQKSALTAAIVKYFGDASEQSLPVPNVTTAQPSQNNLTKGT